MICWVYQGTSIILFCELITQWPYHLKKHKKNHVRNAAYASLSWTRLAPPTALALHRALPIISLKSLRSHISPDLEGFQDLYGRHLPPRLLDPLHELELELIQTQMAQKPMLRAEVGMRVRCANKASAG